MSTGAARRERFRSLVAALPLAGGFVALAAWSWGKWTDVHIDFGNELYLAWRLSEGDVLYRDLAYRHGPLSAYWNAACFALFGVSLRTLVWVNLAVLAAIVAMSWRVFATTLGRRAATAACAVLLGVFAFSQYTPIANYNYVTPYHHQQTHGLALSMAMILALGRAARSGGAGAWTLAGLCLGGVLLTKVELAVPAALAALAGVALARPDARGPHSLLLFGSAALVPALGFTLYLGTFLPLGDALAGVLGNLRHLGPGLLTDPFYRAVWGADDAAGNALRMLRAGAWVGGFCVLAAAADRLAERRLGAAGVAALGVASFGVWIAVPRAGQWLELARALPLIALLGLALLAGAWWRGGVSERQRLAPLLLWGLWSLALLGKLGLYARFGHYGFALAMPATLLGVALAVEVLPTRLARAYGGGRLARVLIVAALAAGLVGCLRVSNGVYARKTLVVGRGADAIRAEGPRASPRPTRVQRALERLAAWDPAPATLLVLPEGVGLNYWLRLENPTPYSLYLPTEIRAFGESAMLEALRGAPPDAVVLLHRGHREFGVGPFGEDPRYGRGIAEWLRAEYQRIERIGPEPFGDQGFGVVLLRRRGRGGAEPAALR